MNEFSVKKMNEYFDVVIYKIKIFESDIKVRLKKVDIEINVNGFKDVNDDNIF